MANKFYILPVIVISQFFCTSLWFAGNAVIVDLMSVFQLSDNSVGHLTSAVQFGFITGTLIFALLTIADRFSPSKVFLGCALIGALMNLGALWNGNGFVSLMSLRFATGFFLAGIYPVGMKIAADYFDQGLGKSLGFLVGALVLGTAFPHLLKGYSSDIPWRMVIVITSALASIGGLLMFLLVPNGPFRRPSQKLDITSFFKVFRKKNFRRAAFGYFGHMWELYAFWAFVPTIIFSYMKLHSEVEFSVSILSFIIIAVGSLSCVMGGFLSKKIGPEKMAYMALLLSGLCCLLSPLAFMLSPMIFTAFLIFWGMVVIADSPMFSTLVAQNADPEIRGTALTIVNCIGFAITIFSIQIITVLFQHFNPQYLYLILAIGPIFGLVQSRMNS